MALLDVDYMKKAGKSGLSQEYINEHWQDRDAEGNSLFQYAIINKLSTVISSCLENENISNMIVAEHALYGTTIHLAALDLESESFKKLVEKSSPESISHALVEKNPTGWTTLYVVIDCQRGEALSKLVGKASIESINQALGENNPNGWTPLHLAARNPNSEAFLTLINKASVDSISQALLKITPFRSTVLHLAAQNQNSEGFLKLLEKASPEAINQALVQKNSNGWTGLHFVARNQNSEAFLKLLDKASPEAINQVLMEMSAEGWTPFHVTARYLNSEVFTKFLDKSSPDAINKALLQKDAEGWTGLHFIARYQNSETLLKLVEKAPSEVVNKLLVDKQSGALSVLDLAASHQSTEAFAKLFDRACDGTYENYRSIIQDNNLSKATQNVTLAFAIKNECHNLTNALLENEKSSLSRAGSSVSRMFSREASIDRKDKEGKTAVDYAIELGVHLLFMKLKMAGAKVPVDKILLEKITGLYNQACDQATDSNKINRYGKWMEALDKQIKENQANSASAGDVVLADDSEADSSRSINNESTGLLSNNGKKTNYSTYKNKK